MYHEMQLESLTEDLDSVELEITLHEFEQICQPIFEKCMLPVDQALNDAGLQKEQIDDIILVGGSSRIVKLQQILSDHFGGKDLNKQLNPDEAVAYGATVQAGILKGKQAIYAESYDDDEEEEEEQKEDKQEEEKKGNVEEKKIDEEEKKID